MSSKRGFAKGRKRATDDYEEDGFVVDDDNDAPKSKKMKAVRKSKKTGGIANGMLTDDNGDPYWELSTLRRVTVSEFKGKSMVNIREYYEKEGKTLPGKKGISLTVEQYTELLKAVPAVESVLASKGQNIPRPNYDGDGVAAPAEQDDGEDEDDGIEKKNFEATSDEESA